MFELWDWVRWCAGGISRDLASFDLGMIGDKNVG